MTATTRRRGRGNRPAGQVHAAALETAADLLFGEGIDAVTHERVSRSAGVSKTTLYRYWPSAGGLAAEAYLHRSEPALELPDTGDFAEDLITQMRRFVALVTSPDAGRAIRGIIAAAQSDDAVRQEYLRQYVIPRRRLTHEAFLRAVDRGQVWPEADFDAFIDQLWGACYYRLLVEPEAVTRDYGDTLVRQALRGIGARPGRGAS